MVQDGVHPQILSPDGRNDVQKIGMPAGGFEVGGPVQQQVLLFPAEEGDRLIDLPAQGIAGGTHRRHGDIQFTDELAGQVVDAVEVDVLPLQENGGEGAPLRGGNQLLHRLRRHGAAAEHPAAHEAVLSAEGDAAVKGEEFLDGAEHGLVPAGG